MAVRLSICAAAMAALVALTACGGEGSDTRTNTPSAALSANGSSPTAQNGACSLEARQRFATATFDEWYLFPALLDSTADPADFDDVQSYIDALVAPARARSRDRFFSFITSIEEENAFFSSGASGGFGVRLSYDTAARRAFVAETFEGTAALAANIDRGSEILAIGRSSGALQTVDALMAAGGVGQVVAALGPNEPGIRRVLRVRDQAGVTREVALTKTSFSLDPVSDRYGAQIINDGDRRVGYLNLRTFISAAEQDLRSAFAMFRQNGVRELIIDFRYNGGGAVTIADQMGDLMGASLAGQVYGRTTFRASKNALDTVTRFQPGPESIASMKIAFIGTQSTASASELVINGMLAHVSDIALVGTNTFGKPVGQSAFDLAACDDRLRVVTIQIRNADGQGDYFDGLAPLVPNTCRAEDDLRFPLGDPREAMVSTALDFLAGRSCDPISTGARSAQALNRRGLLEAPLEQRSAAQHEVPGLF